MPNDPEVCACGLPLHYRDAAARALVEDVVNRLGPDVEITIISKGTWLVPRHFIALHGLKAADIEQLAKRYNFKQTVQVWPMR